MQGTTYILENHVHILKYFIKLKYTVNCLQRARVCVCIRVRLFSKFKQSVCQNSNGQNHRVCMEMPIIIC